MKRDYPELEGKVIKYVNPDFPEITSALVVGVNYDIGITLVNAEDTTDYLCCLTGPLSPQWERCMGTESEKREEHKKLFAARLKMIKDGKFHVVLPDDPRGDWRGYIQPSTSTCSFAA